MAINMPPDDSALPDRAVAGEPKHPQAEDEQYGGDDVGEVDEERAHRALRLIICFLLEHPKHAVRD